MDEDFLKLSKMFDAMRSVVRVPSLDPKYKIAVLASNQVNYSKLVLGCLAKCCRTVQNMLFFSIY